ncbi:MAG: deoxyribodipyrimidine photo-lyase, partial [Bacteroidales bacterium]|nr:deoxyribodipyrimidine photo-lyase [Bacteroidales bacterium]
MVRKERVQQLKKSNLKNGPVIYWMSRDQRAHDNWALQFARELSASLNQSMAVVFCLSPGFQSATLRQYNFMLKGLQECAKDLEKMQIPFYLLRGEPASELAKFSESMGVSEVVTDFDPLRIKKKWKDEFMQLAQAGLYEVDAHNIVPCRFVSQKCEFGAYTLRPKIKRNLETFLDEFPTGKIQKQTAPFSFQEINWDEAYKFVSADSAVNIVDWIKPGQAAAGAMLSAFLEKKFDAYSQKRNDPTEDVTSNLSPYLHFGQISAQRITLEILVKHSHSESAEAFLEELIVRRELSDNYCFYNPYYDSFEGFPEWARKTLNEHRNDEREYTYSFAEFENAQTHDRLWNAAQQEVVRTGKMHGYMRMYWAKKILEWTKSPEEALDFSIRLNDRYQLDGRDPNGY